MVLLECHESPSERWFGLPNPWAIFPSQLPWWILGFKFGSNNLLSKLSLREQMWQGNEGPGALKLRFLSKNSWHIAVWRTGSWPLWNYCFIYMEMVHICSFMCTWSWFFCPIIYISSHWNKCSREVSMNNCNKGYSYNLFFHSQWGCCWQTYAFSCSYNRFFHTV